MKILKNQKNSKNSLFDFTKNGLRGPKTPKINSTILPHPKTTFNEVSTGMKTKLSPPQKITFFQILETRPHRGISQENFLHSKK